MKNRELHSFEKTLFVTIEKGDLNKSKQCINLIKKNQDERLNALDEDGNSFLLFALHAKQINIAHVLFDLFIEENMHTLIWKENHLNQTILHLAAKQKIPTSLLENFLHSCPFDEKHASKEEVIFDKVNQLDQLGNTPLHYACLNNMEDTIYFLLKNGARIDIKNIEGRLAIHLAVKQGNSKIVEKLLVEMDGVDISEITDIYGQNLLHDACADGHVDTVDLLLKRGLNPHLLNMTDQSALDLTIYFGIKAMPDKQSDYGKIITLLNKYGVFIAKDLAQEFSIYLTVNTIFNAPYTEPFYLLGTHIGKKPIKPCSVIGIFNLHDTLEWARTLYKEKNDDPVSAHQFNALLWHCRKLLTNTSRLSKDLRDFCTSCINLNDTLQDRLVALLNTPQFFKKATKHLQVLPKDLSDKLTLFNKNKEQDKKKNDQTLREMLLQLEMQTNILITKLRNNRRSYCSTKINATIFVISSMLGGMSILVFTALLGFLLLSTDIDDKNNKWVEPTIIISACLGLFFLTILLTTMIRNLILTSRICHQDELIDDLEKLKNALPENSPFHQRLANLINQLIENSQNNFTHFISDSTNDSPRRIEERIELLEGILIPILRDLVISCNPTHDIKLYRVSNNDSSLQEIENNVYSNINNEEFNELLEKPLIKYKKLG